MVICSGYNVLTKEVYNVQGAWHSVNMLPTVVHGLTFYIITWQPLIHCKNQPNMSDKKMHNVSYTYKNRNYKGLTEEEKQMLNRSLKTWKLQRTNTGKHYISIFILYPCRDFNTYWSFVWHTWSWCRLLIIWYRHIFSWSVIWIRMHWFHVTESRRL